MSNLRHAATMALEALEWSTPNVDASITYEEAITALRAALAEPEQEPVLLECVTCGTVYADGVPPQVRVQEPVAYIHKETGLLRREINRPKGADWDANYWEPLYASPAPTAEDIAQDWDLLKATQESLREHMAEIQRLRAALAEPEQEPVAWRTFDGEGGYDYRTYEDNEDYAAEWAKRNPQHVGWVEPLYTAPPQRKPWLMM